ncbi:uncharacterized protein LOC113280452 [Papaver somniferum]|uniref:uncharacterized protein LOC113280452 n=1 Tax=Papaver somniferum TaxID=3469 RepID=UPI000E6FE35F|nr:uncharacterized protein LOC113280452 [Papaver somniferum]
MHFVYGETNRILRQASWEQQCQQPQPPTDEPVFFVGDFNALLGHEDKNGGLSLDDDDFFSLRNFCNTFNLHDPGFSVPRFTWSNMQQDPDLILERLDRCFVNPIDETLCPKLCVNNLPKDSSDHCPMHIGFNYEDVYKFLSTKKGLRDWNKNSFGNIQTNISTIRKEIHDVQISNATDSSTTSRLKNRLEYLYNLEELYWKDKSREVWLLEGDMNSPYFHRITLYRRKRNAISWIKNAANDILTDRASISDSFIDYFKNLYSSHPQQFQDEILQSLPPKFFEENYSILNLPLTPEEIKNVVFQMVVGEKAQGPDGFTGLFYQKLWDIVGEAVIDMTQTCFRTGHIGKVNNHTNISLIPKVPLAELVTQYRPIGLCNFVYKILSKTLANRLKPFMNNIISQQQNAFIPKRSISDNILLVNEDIYVVNHNDKTEGIDAIKLDISKAYDKLEWPFLQDVLTKMGLSLHWRGLRQGDPLSPYLYIKCSEALSAYVDSLAKKGDLDGIKVCKNALEMTHLLFADDSILFSKATAKKLQTIKDDLQKNCLASGQEINFEKSSILFNSKIPEHRKAMLASILEIEIGIYERSIWELPQCSKLLKSKSYGDPPSCGCQNLFVAAKTWRCLHAIKEIIKPFVSWIVGDGKFIDFWCDKWIPSVGTATPNPLVLYDPRIKVSYFINPISTTWDINRLNTHFDNASIQKIINIPLSQLCTPGRRACDLTKDGKFTSKSAYLGINGITHSPCKNLCLRILKIRVPHRIQIFLWRAARNAMPYRTILHTGMPMLSIECARCLHPHESVMHALVTCPFASHVCRNNLIFQNQKENYRAVIHKAKAMLLTRKNNHIINLATIISLGEKWVPPFLGWIKCNTDGAYDELSGENGAGYMMRNSFCKASLCATLVFHVQSTEEAEAREIWSGLQKALKEKFTHIIIESDAKNLIDKFSAGYFDGDSRTDAIFKDIQFFSSQFVECIFSFQPRSCNNVAHELAKWEKNNNSTMYWSVPPVWLLPTVEGDH